MIEITNEQWQQLSFPDSNILTMIIHDDGLDMTVDSGFLDSPIELTMGTGFIKFTKCQDIKIRSYNPDSKLWYDTCEILKDLCEVEFRENVILRGFGKKSGLWTELTLIKPAYKQAIFNDDVRQ